MVGLLGNHMEPNNIKPPLEIRYDTGSREINPKLTISFLLVALTLLMTSCNGGSQIEDTPIPEAEVVVKVEAMPSPTKSPASNQAPSTNPGVNLRFRDAVTEHIKTSWSTWPKGEIIGQCLIANAGSLDNEAKEAVIEHGIEEAFDELSGTHLESLSKAWNLCDSKDPTLSTSSSSKTPSATTTPSSTDSTSAPVRALDFKSANDHQSFSEALQIEFQDVVNEHYDAATDKAGISVAVYQNGHLWRYAKGKASSSDKMTVGTPILIRSTSKTFLAGLVLQQIDEGLYSLSDTLHSILSGSNDYQLLDKNIINPNVTIEQMLTMTSGIENVKDYYRKEITELQENLNWRPVEMVQLVTTPFAPPGTYNYVNTNTVLLGLIAEHAGQHPLNELYESELFDPLGIVAVLLPQDVPPPNTARPHGDRSQWGGAGFGDISESSHHSDWYRATGRTTWAAAGIITTPENVARWAYELLSDQGSALSPTARARLLDSFTGPLIAIGGSEPEHRYGYHVTKTTLSLSNSTITAFGHPGSGGGYTSDFFYSPELDMSISLVVNSHSDARTRAEAQGKITHRTLGDIAWQIFETYTSKGPDSEE